LDSANNIGVIKTTRLRLTGLVARTVEKMCGYRISLRKPERKRLLGIPIWRSEDNIKIDPKEIRWEVWAGLIWLGMGNNLVETVMSLHVLSNAGNFLCG
jgi:hypothetical protein